MKQSYNDEFWPLFQVHIGWIDDVGACVESLWTADSMQDRVAGMESAS